MYGGVKGGKVFNIMVCGVFRRGKRRLGLVLICDLVITIRVEIQMVSRVRVGLIGSVEVIDVVVKGRQGG